MMVPLYKQEFPWSCFATCIRMILEYYEVRKTEKELRILLKTTPTYGTLWEFVESEIRKLWFELIWKKFWNLEELRILIKQSIPIIVGIKSKLEEDNHVVVLLNVSEEYVTIVDSDNGELVKVTMSKFLNMWNERNNIAGYIKKIEKKEVHSTYHFL